MDGLWNKLSGSETAAVVDNMTTGVSPLSPALRRVPWSGPLFLEEADELGNSGRMNRRSHS